MARTVELGDYQAMQRSYEPTIADMLEELNVEASCTAEMSLHMITERVRDAALGLPAEYAPTENDVVLEAERIWSDFGDQRKGPREALVNGDGTVRDWRRPDTTPDRGPDVGTTVHAVSDDEARFSGAGASDGPEPSKLVPADAAFGSKLYLDSADLANIAEQLIESKDYFEHLLHCQIRYAWRRKIGTKKRRRQTGGLKRGTDWFGQLLGADFGIFLAADTARERGFTERHIRRYLTHELLKIGQDDNGNFVEQAPTLQVFAPEISEYADVADEHDLIGRSAYRNAEQMGLFDVDDEDDFDDDEEREDAARAGYVETPDGAGVLIHADGTPLTDDEIEAMERHEQDDDDEDILADPAVI